MFSTQEIGLRISKLRKQMNMTQMELADRLNISFQAVSNWERGNTMPDISKLPELADLFGISIDELFGKSAPILHAAVNDALSAYVQEIQPALEELAEIAPILKPAQLDEAFEHAQKEEINDDALGALAPFLSTTLLDEIAEKRFAEGKTINRLLPFISEAACTRIAHELYTRDGISGILPLAPFLPDKALEEFAQLEYDVLGIDGIRSLAPFLRTAYLDALAQRAIERDGISAILPLAPFLSNNFLSKYVKERYL